MKALSFLSLASLLSPALANPEWATNPPTLDPFLPMYLASVFFPPQMHFALWTPPTDPEGLHSLDPLSWCHDAQDVSDHLSIGSRTSPFTYKGVDGLKIHDFFAEQAYITRHGTRFANCWVGPQSGNLGMCGGNEANGERFVGVAERVWSCWVIGTPDRNKDVVAPREGNGEGVTRGAETVLGGKETGAVTGSERNVAWTAAVTGS